MPFVGTADMCVKNFHSRGPPSEWDEILLSPFLMRKKIILQSVKQTESFTRKEPV